MQKIITFARQININMLKLCKEYEIKLGLGVIMKFVFSLWLVVGIPVLLLGIIVCTIVLFKMDKKDRQLINELAGESSDEVQEETEIAGEDATETTNNAE